MLEQAFGAVTFGWLHYVGFWLLMLAGFAMFMLSVGSENPVGGGFFFLLSLALFGAALRLTM